MTNPDFRTGNLLLIAALLCLAIPPGLFGASEPGSSNTSKFPAPPLVESFEGTPQLSLLPRLGDFRPEDGEERLPIWLAFRDHLRKISGVIQEGRNGANHLFSFRGIRGVDSVGFFAPLAVKPDTAYMLRLRLKVALDEPARAGIGILEYRGFLTYGSQYPRSLHQTGFLASQELLCLADSKGWRTYSLNFRTGRATGMIHLVLFREGPAEDRTPILIDDIFLAEE